MLITDNGSENEKEFSELLKNNNIVHFYSRLGTLTDNPRVERSHLTDEMELYSNGGICKTFKEQKSKLLNHEYVYNSSKWKAYLKKQKIRLANSRKIKNKEKIEKLMQQIDNKTKS